MDADSITPYELEKRRIERAIETLEDALTRCRSENMWTPKVHAALRFLEQHAKQKRLLDQFREGLQNNGHEDQQLEDRWQTLNASLNGIKLAVGRNELVSR